MIDREYIREEGEWAYLISKRDNCSSSEGCTCLLPPAWPVGRKSYCGLEREARRSRSDKWIFVLGKERVASGITYSTLVQSRSTCTESSIIQEARAIGRWSLLAVLQRGNFEKFEGRSEGGGWRRIRSLGGLWYRRNAWLRARQIEKYWVSKVGKIVIHTGSCGDRNTTEPAGLTLECLNWVD